jgi:hypothetical protein
MASRPRRSAAVAASALIGLTTFGWGAPAPVQAAGDQPTVTWSGPHALGGLAWDIDHDGDGWITVGLAEPTGTYEPRAWTSPDGESWTAANVEARDEPAVDGYQLLTAERLGDTLYALGTKVGNADERNLRGWQSTDDGDSWQVIESTAGIYAEGFIALDADASDATLVAAESFFSWHIDKLWAFTEADGWTETTPASPHPDGSGIEVEDILYVDGIFVAVGTSAAPSHDLPNRPLTAASWVSTDGVTWTPSVANPALADHWFSAVAPRPGGGYVAIGHDGVFSDDNGTPQAWTSPDGLTWTEVEGPRGDPGAKGTHLVAIDGGLLALVAEPKWAGTQAFTSTDGTSWNFVGRFPHMPWGVAATPSGEEVVILTTFGNPRGDSESFSHHGIIGPPGPEQTPQFTDIADSPFREDIEWIAAQGITRGCTPTRFCPDEPVLREQMATFLYRSFGFDITNDDFFTDDEHTIHEGAINRLAAAEVTNGCASERFCPAASVTREQMASFLVRTLDLPPASRDWFTDDESSFHEDDINRLRESGITRGCSTTLFCPTVPVPREQMAALLHRALTR